jgi:stage V sporulation protein AD
MVIKMKHPVYVESYAAIGGKAEKEGPLGAFFDEIDESERFGQKTWEQAEGEMQRRALTVAMKKANVRDEDVALLFAGDLMNQCTSSSYGLLSFEISQVGLYGACSTAAESAALAAMACDLTKATCAAVTSSHFCSAERQFRFPLEYGGQKSPTAQRTVTGAGACVIGQKPSKIRIREVLFGRSIDSKISDIGNMGAAMAPAAADTLTRFFTLTQTRPEDYTKIVTGDLGREGYEILKIMMAQKELPIDDVYDDCGLLVYHAELQDMHAGGSGCGCSAVVAATKLFRDMEEGVIDDLLFIGTGALMSPTSVQQGLSIPGVAHLVHFVKECESYG